MWWNMSGFIWKLGIDFAVCIKWIDETWWNNRLLLVPNCYEVVVIAPVPLACDATALTRRTKKIADTR